MKEILKYGVIVLGVLLLNIQITMGQEEVKRRSLKELQQLEKGYVAVDEVEPPIMVHLSEPEDIIFIGYQGTTNLRLWKRLEDVSNSKRFSFNVEKGYADVNFMIFGEIKEGSFKIKLYKPDNQLLKEVKVTPGNDQNWNQSFCLEENEGKGFVGKWSVELSCNNATGYYQFVSNSR